MVVTKNKLFFFQCGVFNLFIFLLSLSKFSCTVSDSWLHQHLIAHQYFQLRNSSELQHLSKLQGTQPMRNRLPRTQRRQAGHQKPEGRQNHPGKRLYLHQAHQHRACSRWFHRNRRKYYCILKRMWCLLRLPGAVTEGLGHQKKEFPSH